MPHASLLLRLTRDLHKLLDDPAAALDILDLDIESEYRFLKPNAIEQLSRILVLFASHLHHDVLHPVVYRQIATMLIAEISRNNVLSYFLSRSSFDSFDWMAIQNCLRVSPTYFHPIVDHITSRCGDLLTMDIKAVINSASVSANLSDCDDFRRVVSTLAILAAFPLEARLSSLAQSHTLICELLAFLKRLLNIELVKGSSAKEAAVLIDHIAMLLYELCVASDNPIMLNLSSVLALSQDLCRRASTLRLLMQSLLGSLRAYRNSFDTASSTKPRTVNLRKGATLRSSKTPKPFPRTKEEPHPLRQLCEGDALSTIAQLLLHGNRAVRIDASKVLMLCIAIVSNSAVEIKDLFTITALKYHTISLLEMVRYGFRKLDSNEIWPEVDVREAASSTVNMILSYMSLKSDMRALATKVLRFEGKLSMSNFCILYQM